MSSVILEAHDLTKEYRHTVALDHIDLKIEKGKIYGFIGQNGAGKTTFLRLVTGLAFPTSGTLSLWGKTVEKELQEQRKRIGCMIETPALFPTMTAYQNMEIQRIQRGIPDKAVIQKTLDMVGLKDTGKKAVRNFSLGMRQRLGIAIALLNTPEFLILDEPINGLDPAGIVEIRNLLKSLNKEYGMTILVSSHFFTCFQNADCEKPLCVCSYFVAGWICCCIGCKHYFIYLLPSIPIWILCISFHCFPRRYIAVSFLYSSFKLFTGSKRWICGNDYYGNTIDYPWYLVKTD